MRLTTPFFFCPSRIFFPLIWLQLQYLWTWCQERRTERCCPRLWPVDRFCERVWDTCPQAVREEKCWPLDYMSQTPLIHFASRMLLAISLYKRVPVISPMWLRSSVFLNGAYGSDWACANPFQVSFCSLGYVILHTDTILWLANVGVSWINEIVKKPGVVLNFSYLSVFIFVFILFVFRAKGFCM